MLRGLATGAAVAGSLALAAFLAAPVPLGKVIQLPAGVVALVYFLLCAIIPHFLLAPLLVIAHPLSAAIGVLYAWKHNQKGERA